MPALFAPFRPCLTAIGEQSISNLHPWAALYSLWNDSQLVMIKSIIPFCFLLHIRHVVLFGARSSPQLAQLNEYSGLNLALIHLSHYPLVILPKVVTLYQIILHISFSPTLPYSLKLNPKGTVYYTVTNIISDSCLPDNLVLTLYWKLGGNHGWSSSVSILHDF